MIACMLKGDITDTFNTINDYIANFIGDIYSNPLERVVMFTLIASGIYFTAKTRAVQLRLFLHMIVSMVKSRKGAEGSISSFQAFAIGLASRVGTGNIAGVAIAIVIGGPGAVFWMWIIALIGMATACMESILAQLYKVPAPDGTFRGGPAYYIQRGLGSRGWGKVFAVMLIFAFGFSFNMVQANTISVVTTSTFGIDGWVVGLSLIILTTLVIFGGLKPVARSAEIIAPVMALAYIVMAIAIIAVNIDQVPGVLMSIIKGAFGFDQVTGGVTGGMLAAMTNGAKRGLFSNEAGMGSVPNAAATATVSHPVQQGLVQSLAVFVDTMLVCTSTAFIVLLGGIYKPGDASLTGADLTIKSMSNVLGQWTVIPMVVIIFLFGYSSVLGNYAYAEINVNFLRGMNASMVPLKILVIISVGVGSVASLTTAWNLADVFSGLMAVLNLFAVFTLGKWAIGALRDYEAQRKSAKDHSTEPVFISTNNPYMPGELDSQEWTKERR
ncbi:alanine:cation symporter family protein [Actinomyces sp. zg-332]|uniref:alanine/glycine:cation symporter family protein n=1 Tax=Actinomyces sp. zg-332 TaxID=2708340 RepID=UPI001424895D|nr:alanine/glycine:cation symporter family protein [Actinomyces sp. zg-332]QPK93897.1 alanine:cation symporter family protein [Actinomyces sp. zg-332]